MTGTETHCPKCGLDFGTLLHPHCQHNDCPPRAYAYDSALRDLRQSVKGGHNLCAASMMPLRAKGLISNVRHVGMGYYGFDLTDIGRATLVAQSTSYDEAGIKPASPQPTSNDE